VKNDKVHWNFNVGEVRGWGGDTGIHSNEEITLLNETGELSIAIYREIQTVDVTKL
jgi:hypothetical protein